VQKYKKSGEKAEDMYDELAVQDIVGGHVIGHRASRPSLYQRKLMKVGCTSLNVDIKAELGDSAYISRASRQYLINTRTRLGALCFVSLNRAHRRDSPWLWVRSAWPPCPATISTRVTRRECGLEGK
jgi:hypothetical protein